MSTPKPRAVTAAETAAEAAAATAAIAALGDAASLDVGTTAGTVAAGDDPRFTDARTPTAHAASHALGGSDPLRVGVLAHVAYDPAPTGSPTDVTTTSGTLVALDATNVTVTFTAPASGRVSVYLEAVTLRPSAADQTKWGLVDTGGTQVGNSILMSAIASYLRLGATVVVTGLTPGSSYTYRFAHATTTATSTTATTRYSGGWGPALMVVTALP